MVLPPSSPYLAMGMRVKLALSVRGLVLFILFWIQGNPTLVE